MVQQASLKDQLKDYCANPNKKRTSLTVEVIRDKQAQISDSSRYFFSSKNFEQVLKQDKVKGKKLLLKLQKWKFVQNRKNQLELEVEKYKILDQNAKNIKNKNSNILNQKTIINLLESLPKDQAKQTKKKSARATPIKQPISPRQTTNKKKIKKKSSDAEKIAKSLKSQKQTPKKSVKGKRSTIKKLTDRGLSSTNKYSPTELIFASEFNVNNRPASVSVPRKLTGAKEFKNLNQNYEQQFLMNRQQNLNYDKELQKNRQASTVRITDDQIPTSLKNEQMTYSEILHGIQKGLISWEEIKVNYQVISKIIV